MEPIERTFKTEFELSKESTYYKLEALRSNEYPGKLFNEIMGKKKNCKTLLQFSDFTITYMPY